MDELSIDDIKKKIIELTALKNELKNEEQAIKLTMNSIYGAIGNNYFACFNPDVAEAVTLQGQDLIKFSEKVVFKYFNEYWANDTELHQKLGITKARKVTNPMTIYGDTDSNYVTFQEVISSCDYKGDPKQFILDINEYRLKGYLKKCFEVYSKKWGTVNYQDFELENIAINLILLGKKKYVANLVYEDGVHIDPLKRMKIVGVEMIKGGTPPFVREKLEYLTKHIFARGKNFNIKEFVKELKDIKRDFKLQSTNMISQSININDYNKYVINDTTAIEVGKGCPIHVRASAHYNYTVNNSKYKDKYSLIKSSDKINYYFVKVEKETDNNVFGYPQGTYPREIAPHMDFDTQFTKTILDPINRFIAVMGYNPISPNLFRVNALF